MLGQEKVVGKENCDAHNRRKSTWLANVGTSVRRNETSKLVISLRCQLTCANAMRHLGTMCYLHKFELKTSL